MRGEPDYRSRRHEVLAAILREHIASGLPVGSKMVAKQVSGNLSSATIRNVMAELEDEGYLVQLHTSAGRIPTEKAYRFYVDRVVSMARLSPALEQFIESNLRVDGAVPEILMARASHVLSEVSHNVGLVLGPALEEKLLEHIKLIKLPENRVLVVVVSKPDLVENKVIRLEEDVSQEEMDRAANYLRTEFRGWSLGAIRLEILNRVEEARAVVGALLSNVARLLREGALGNDQPGPLFVEGAAKILDQPEFEDVKKLRKLLEAFEEKVKLVSILGASLQASDAGVQVLIGRENPAHEMQHCALVIAPLQYHSRVVGALGVVGPTRMEYDRAVPTVEYVAYLCSRLLSIN